MNPDSVELWLVRKKEIGFAQHVLLGAFALLAGIVVLFLTFWFTYAIIWFGWHGVSAVSQLMFSKSLHLSHAVRLICSGAFIVLLFIQNSRVKPSSNWENFPQQNYKPASIYGGRSMIGALTLMLAYPGASANIVADILLTGPRLVIGPFQLIKKGFYFGHLDVEGCGRLLGFLQTQEHLVSFLDLEAAGWDAWFEQLRGIDGVQFLQRGIILSEELRNELNNLN